MRTSLIFFFGVVIAFWTSSTNAENLHQKYGSYWNCGYISLGMPIYDACKPCEDKGMEFFRDSDTTGHCVPKTGVAESKPEEKQPAPKRPNVRYTIRFCNDTGVDTLYVALGTIDELGGVMRYTLRGWYSVPVGVCENLAVKNFGRYSEMVFAYHAQAGNNFWPTKVLSSDKKWSTEDVMRGKDAEQFNFCVDLANRFEIEAVPSVTCKDKDRRAFGIVWVEKEDATEMVVKEVHVK